MIIYTIGFTGKKAEQFFNLLKAAKVKRVIDVRLNNSSQLAAFAKKDDLAYFLKEICCIEYLHMPNLAPTEDILKEYKKKNMSWAEYEIQYNHLLKTRAVEEILSEELLASSCFLCSEQSPDFCHRRLAVEYLKMNSPYEIKIKHLV